MQFSRIVIVMIALLWPAYAGAAKLDDIKQKGFVECGVVPSIPGFSFVTADGDRVGFDADVCRALAAAIFADQDKVRFLPISPRDALTSLQSGGMDILVHRLTWTFARDVGSGLNYTRIMLYDGQGFMVRKALGIKSAAELDGAVICATQGTTTELNLADFFRAHGKEYSILAFGDTQQGIQAYDAGRCDAYSADRMNMAGRATRMLSDASAHMVLPDVISKETIGPLVAHGQDHWADVARWVFNALIAAEELGINSENVETMRSSSTHPEVQRLLGVTGDFGKQLQLSNDWAYNVIKLVGNYGELFEKHLGTNSPLGLDRGQNELWKNGGLLISMPFR